MAQYNATYLQRNQIKVQWFRVQRPRHSENVTLKTRSLYRDRATPVPQTMVVPAIGGGASVDGGGAYTYQ